MDNMNVPKPGKLRLLSSAVHIVDVKQPFGYGHDTYLQNGNFIGVFDGGYRPDGRTDEGGKRARRICREIKSSENQHVWPMCIYYNIKQAIKRSPVQGSSCFSMGFAKLCKERLQLSLCGTCALLRVNIANSNDTFIGLKSDKVFIGHDSGSRMDTPYDAISRVNYSVFPLVKTFEVQDGDVLIMGTGALWDNLEMDFIKRVVRKHIFESINGKRLGMVFEDYSYVSDEKLSQCNPSWPYRKSGPMSMSIAAELSLKAAENLSRSQWKYSGFELENGVLDHAGSDYDSSERPSRDRPSDEITVIVAVVTSSSEIYTHSVHLHSVQPND